LLRSTHFRRFTNDDNCFAETTSSYVHECNIIMVKRLYGNYPHQTIRTDRQWLWDHSIKFARWQHPATEHWARLAAAGIACILLLDFTSHKQALTMTPNRVHCTVLCPATPVSNTVWRVLNETEND